MGTKEQEDNMMEGKTGNGRGGEEGDKGRRLSVCQRELAVEFANQSRDRMARLRKPRSNCSMWVEGSYYTMKGSSPQIIGL